MLYFDESYFTNKEKEFSIRDNLYFETYQYPRFPLTEEEINLLDYQESLNEAIDLDTGAGGKLRPVFIVLVYNPTSGFVKIAHNVMPDQKYWHASIAFGPSLSKCYSFGIIPKNIVSEKNRKKFLHGGFVIESLKKYIKEDPNTKIEVDCIFLYPDRFAKLKETVDYYINNADKTQYSFLNLAKMVFNIKDKNGLRTKLVCSEFVDTVLKSVNINVARDDKNKDVIRNSNLVKPGNLHYDKKNEKQFKLFEGKITNYSIKKITDKVEKLSDDVNSEWFEGRDDEDED